MANNHSQTFNALNPSAPPLEPHKWNNFVSNDFLVGDFMKAHKAQLININAFNYHFEAQDSPQQYYDYFNSKEIQEKSSADLSSPDPTLSAARIRGAVEKFLIYDKNFQGNDQILAEKFGLSESQVASFREPATSLYLGQGFQEQTNCYSYAMNDMDRYSESGDQPGFRSLGKRPSASNYQDYKKELLDGVYADGAIPGGENAGIIPGYYRVAVFSMPPERMEKGESNTNMDFHFVRENGDGTWSHKPGRMGVTDLDQDHKTITDPKTANIGGYDFITFVYVPEGGLDVGRPNEPSTKPGSVQPSENVRSNDAPITPKSAPPFAEPLF